MTKPKPNYEVITEEDMDWITDHFLKAYIRLGYVYEKDGRFYATEKARATPDHKIEKLEDKLFKEAVIAKINTPEGLATEPNIRLVDSKAGAS